MRRVLAWAGAGAGGGAGGGTFHGSVRGLLRAPCPALRSSHANLMFGEQETRPGLASQSPHSPARVGGLNITNNILIQEQIIVTDF